jgi:hypothetical protein
MLRSAKTLTPREINLEKLLTGELETAETTAETPARSLVTSS